MWNRKRNDGHINVLIAEDRPHDQLLFLMAADDCQSTTRVTFAGDGLHLLDAPMAQLESERPNVIVLDLEASRLGGYETLEAIRSNPQLTDVPVVVFASSSDPNEVRRSLDAGALQHVVKPSTFAGLLNFLESLSEISTAGVTEQQAA